MKLIKCSDFKPDIKFYIGFPSYDSKILVCYAFSSKRLFFETDWIISESIIINGTDLFLPITGNETLVNIVDVMTKQISEQLKRGLALISGGDLLLFDIHKRSGYINLELPIELVSKIPDKSCKIKLKWQYCVKQIKGHLMNSYKFGLYVKELEINSGPDIVDPDDANFCISVSI